MPQLLGNGGRKMQLWTRLRGVAPFPIHRAFSDMLGTKFNPNYAIIVSSM